MPKLKLSKQQSTYNIQSSFIRLMDLGQRRFLSSLLWIITVIESDIEKYNKGDLGSWIYLRFKTISNLDPYFITLYYYAIQYLFIIKSDVPGGIELKNLAMHYYRNDYYLNFIAGFIEFYELKNVEKGLYYFERSIQLSDKAPKYLHSLVARLKSKQGYHQEAYGILLKIYEKTPQNSPLKKKYAQELIELKKKITGS